MQGGLARGVGGRETSLQARQKKRHYRRTLGTCRRSSERWVGRFSVRSKSLREGSGSAPSIDRKNTSPFPTRFQGIPTGDGRGQNRGFRCAAECIRIRVPGGCEGSPHPSGGIAFGKRGGSASLWCASIRTPPCSLFDSLL